MRRCSCLLGRFTFGDIGRCLSLFSSALTRTLGGFRSSLSGLSISLCSLHGSHICSVGTFSTMFPHRFFKVLPLRTSLSISLPLLRAVLARDFAPLFIIAFAFHFITGTAALAADFALHFNIGMAALSRAFTPIFNPTFSIGIAALARPLNRAPRR